MTQKIILPVTLDLAEAIKSFEKNNNLTLVKVGNSTAKTWLASILLPLLQKRHAIWIAGDMSAEQIKLHTELFCDHQTQVVDADFSLRDFYLWYQQIASQKNQSTILIPVDAAQLQENMWPQMQDIQQYQCELKIGTKINIYKLFDELGNMGYQAADDTQLEPGQFIRQGEAIFIFPWNQAQIFRVVLDHDQIEQISSFPDDTKHTKALVIYPGRDSDLPTKSSWLDNFAHHNVLLINDDLENDLHDSNQEFPTVEFTTFPPENKDFFHLNFFSVLPFYTLSDFATEIKERLRRHFKVVVFTKRADEIKQIFKDNQVMWTEKPADLEKYQATVLLMSCGADSFLPHSFQSSDSQLLFLTDREIFHFFRNSRQKKTIAGMNLELMNSLKKGDYVIHTDHGIGRFAEIVRRDQALRGGQKEYLKICYAENDKLFVPVESAEKIAKFIGDESPKLNKLGNPQWQKTQRKLKQETEQMAKQLLQIYAQRNLAKGNKFLPDDEMMKDFCEGFPYELTPGQLESWEQVRIDMENSKPMDRLICGDVGFGKTEIAMRAAFKCFRSGLQCLFLSPITILAEQHYESFLKRLKGKKYDLRVALISRFQSSTEQQKIIADLKSGLVDIAIGTHRLLSEDIQCKNLGLIIIDEEQRFGVQQKEKLQKMRAGTDILTMTATPIPRTLNMGLNRLKDISTIITPPPGRLPVVTEVRKYNLNLIRERIIFELERGGQVYFLHNEVKTIEAQAYQLRTLIPEAKFIVAHGQLTPNDLEDRVRSFKNGEAEVLVASTIIENGIDLARANTLLVNHADKFGLAQLYQLRGRVGRSRTQAYAFFLYHGQKLALDSKKRLRAIVEASELGSGFQIAMRDLEIRGAGEILGVSQSGVIRDAGVAHFIRLLNKTVDEMKAGVVSADFVEEENITVEIPMSAYIPPSYIPDTEEKIRIYQELASITDVGQLENMQTELRGAYGELPIQMLNLLKVIRLKIALRAAKLTGVTINQISHKAHEIALRLGKEFRPEQVFNLLQDSEEKWVITATAIKLSIKNLSMQWYENLLKTVCTMDADKLTKIKTTAKN